MQSTHQRLINKQINQSASHTTDRAINQ